MAVHKQKLTKTPRGLAEIDEGMIPFLQNLWSLGINPRLSCQEEKAGWAKLWFDEAYDMNYFTELYPESVYGGSSTIEFPVELLEDLRGTA